VKKQLKNFVLTYGNKHLLTLLAGVTSNDNLLPAFKFAGIEAEGDIAKNQQVISV